MTSSTSNTSKSSWLALVAMVVFGTGVAEAGHKRVVVLDFEGPKAEKFHDAIVKAIEKKDDTVVATDKWNGAAEELQATKLNKKNARKIAKRLKVDGIVTATIEKSDEGYVVHVKLRAGKTGAVVAEQIDIKAEGTKLSKKEINTQLVGAIDGLDDNSGGGKDDDGGLGGKDEGDDDGGKVPAVTTKKDKSDKSDKTDKSDKSDDKTDKTDTASTDDTPHHHKKPKEDAGADATATTDASGDNASATASVEVETKMPASERLAFANRAVDFGIGMSFTARHLSFSVSTNNATPPANYKEGIPVAGGIMDVIVFPFAITHKMTGILTDIGLEIMYDKVIDISSSKSYIDATTMTDMTVNLPTAEEHFAIGGVLRYPITDSFVPGIKLMYMNQQFEIQQQIMSGMNTVDAGIPDVHYSAFEPRAFFRYAVAGPLTINAEGGIMFITKTGDITADTTGYGGAKDLGFEFNGGVDYNLTKAIFARALFHFEEISMKFKGDTNSLSSDGTSQDVYGAKDYYYGLQVQIGYTY
jgi:hypothetical protein